MVIRARTSGSSAGANPMKEEMYFFRLRGSFSEWPSFPRCGSRGRPHFSHSPPPPPAPGCSAWSRWSPPTGFAPPRPGKFPHMGSVGAHRPDPQMGRHRVPPLMTADTVAASCTGVTWKDWPKETVANSTAPIFSILCIMVDASPGRSMPVFPGGRTAQSIHSNRSTPSLCPTSMSTGLQEFIMPSRNVSPPWPPVLWQRISGPPQCGIPGS